MTANPSLGKFVLFSKESIFSLRCVFNQSYSQCGPNEAATIFLIIRHVPNLDVAFSAHLSRSYIPIRRESWRFVSFVGRLWPVSDALSLVISYTNQRVITFARLCENCARRFLRSVLSLASRRTQGRLAHFHLAHCQSSSLFRRVSV